MPDQGDFTAEQWEETTGPRPEDMFDGVGPWWAPPADAPSAVLHSLGSDRRRGVRLRLSFHATDINDMLLKTDRALDQFAGPDAEWEVEADVDTDTVETYDGTAAAFSFRADVTALLLRAGPKESVGWCEVDGCPVAICGGPHVNHVCKDNSTVTTPSGPDAAPCPLCGWTET